MLIYFYEREREREREGGHVHMSRGGAEREEGRESKASSELSAQSLTWGLNPRTTRSSPELKLDAQSTEPPGRPKKFTTF